MVFSPFIRKSVVWALLAVPGAIFLVVPAISGSFGEKFWKGLLINSGTITVTFFVGLLFLNPLVVIFPRVKLFKKLSCFRTEIGLATFFYTVFHFLAFILRRFEKKGFFDFPVFLKPVVYTGVLGFLIFLMLALTSNNWSVKKLGRMQWKRLHRFAYLAEVILFIHLFLRERLEAILFFLPLLVFQIFRVNKKPEFGYKSTDSKRFHRNLWQRFL